MRKANFIFLLAAAADPRHTHPLVQALRSATTVYEADPDHGLEKRTAIDVPALRAALVAGGFTIIDDEAATKEDGFRRLENLTRVLVKHGKDVVAMGAASDEREALLHAMLGWFREHPLPNLDAPAGVATLSA